MEDLYAPPKRSVANKVMDYALPAMSILEAIITGTASKGNYIGTTGLDVMGARADQEQKRELLRQKAIERSLEAKKYQAESADRLRKTGIEAAKEKREAAKWEQEDKDAQNKANTRAATVDRLIGIPNSYDEKTNTVTRSGVPGVPDLTVEDKAAIQADPIAWLTNRLKPAPTQLVLGGDGTYQAVNRVTGKNPEGKPVTAPPKPATEPGGKAPAGYRWRPDGVLEPIPGGPADGGKPLSGDAAKLTGYVSTALTQGQNLKKLIEDKGIRWVTAQYKAGNPAVANIIDDVADSKGRLRSGGAVNVDEANSFKKPFTGIGNIFYNDDSAAIAAIDQVLTEANTVQNGMKGLKQPPPSASADTTKSDANSIIEELKKRARSGDKDAQAGLKAKGIPF